MTTVDLSELETIIYERPHPRVARIVLNRPETRNAQNARMLQELDAASRTVFYYDGDRQLIHVKLVAKPGQPIGAVWLETRD